mmetsp:Transcript_32229/g.80839  ORF Transcript_32229/g.80839 Transcript_32229/m.80839 type:complete len:203 (+) Transcript_32229:838-1446(+)
MRSMRCASPGRRKAYSRRRSATSKSRNRKLKSLMYSASTASANSSSPADTYCPSARRSTGGKSCRNAATATGVRPTSRSASSRSSPACGLVLNSCTASMKDASPCRSDMLRCFSSVLHATPMPLPAAGAAGARGDGTRCGVLEGVVHGVASGEHTDTDRLLPTLTSYPDTLRRLNSSDMNESGSAFTPSTDADVVCRLSFFL